MRRLDDGRICSACLIASPEDTRAPAQAPEHSQLSQRPKLSIRAGRPGRLGSGGPFGWQGK